MTADTATKPPGMLDPKVGDALLDDQNVMNIMQNPKMVEAIQALKKDPTCFSRLLEEDPELTPLFSCLREQMDEKEKNQANGGGGAPAAAGAAKRTMDSPAVVAAADAPPLAEADELECESAKAAGTRAFEAGEFKQACTEYERATQLQPHHAPHWTNLSVARLRAGDAAKAADAAREATRRNPRFAKGWLRLGEALNTLGETTEAVEVFEAGLQRAEGAIRLALTKGLQQARSVGAAGGVGRGPKSATAAVQRAAGPKAEDPSAAADVAAAAATAAAAVEKAPKAVKPLPTVEDERALAEETARLRKATEDKMKQYADLAKQQTRTVATKSAASSGSAASVAVATSSVTAASATVTASATTSITTGGRSPGGAAVTEADATATAAAAAASTTVAASASTGRRVLVVEDEDEDEDEDGEGERPPLVAPLGPPTSSTALMPPEEKPANQKTRADPAGASPAKDGSAAALGAALAQWSGDRARRIHGEASGHTASSAAAPVVTPAAPMRPAVSLSNDLIFDLA